MRIELRMPQMGESITEATIIKWRKAVGDSVEKDETIVEISTDKVDSEIPAPESGVVTEILAQEGQTVAVQSLIAVLDSEGLKEPVLNEPPAAEPPRAEMPVLHEESFFSPLARKIAQENRLSADELRSIAESGANRRITKEDVLLYLKQRQESPSELAAEQPRQAPAAALKPKPSYNTEGVFIEPMDNMRKRIAEHMVRSKQTSAHVYTMAEVDLSYVSRWRKEKQQSFLEKQGFKLSFTPFFLEALIKALSEYPRMNASVEGDSIVLKQDINLGCAVALGKDGLGGLIVPVIKKADRLSFVGLAAALNELALKARSKKLSPQDVQGGTFTITNPGIFGNIMGCPIINQPQLGILATGAIKKRPVVVDDAIAIREMMYLTLSYDHRVIDGALAGHFLQFIVRHLENWNPDRSL